MLTRLRNEELSFLLLKKDNEMNSFNEANTLKCQHRSQPLDKFKYPSPCRNDCIP